MGKTLITTQLDVNLFNRGKVRDIYELSDDRLLIIATDRISAFDVVMNQGIPDKGKVLTRISKFWFKFLEKEANLKTHFISDILPEDLKGWTYWQSENISIFPLRISSKTKKELALRTIIVKKTNVIPVEWIVRGYLAGSAWKKYQRGEGLKKIWPELKKAEKLPHPVVEYTTKAKSGHDEELNYRDVVRWIEKWFQEINLKRAASPLVDHLILKSLEIYNKAAQYAESRGIIVVDTKFEFGLDKEGELYLVDEVLTPDSSRFWLKENYQSGISQENFDKQPLRDWLEAIGWDKSSSPPELPKELIHKLSQRYQKIEKYLIGER